MKKYKRGEIKMMNKKNQHLYLVSGSSKEEDLLYEQKPFTYQEIVACLENLHAEINKRNLKIHQIKQQMFQCLDAMHPTKGSDHIRYKKQFQSKNKLLVKEENKRKVLIKERNHAFDERDSYMEIFEKKRRELKPQKDSKKIKHLDF